MVDLKRKGSRKGVTDKISKKCFGAFSGLSNCMVRWQVPETSSGWQVYERGDAGANTQKQ